MFAIPTRYQHERHGRCVQVDIQSDDVYSSQTNILMNIFVDEVSAWVRRGSSLTFYITF